MACAGTSLAQAKARGLDFVLLCEPRRETVSCALGAMAHVQAQAARVNGGAAGQGEGTDRTEWYGGATRFELELEVTEPGCGSNDCDGDVY